jgi:formylglycine-generating enzyme required for sulfatase activity
MLKKLLAHQQSPIPTFAAAGVAVAPLVQEVFQRMVAKSLSDRYPSMREAIVDLERCLVDHSHAPTAMVSSSAMGRLAEQVPAVSWPGGPTSQGIATGAAAPVESPPIVFATSASAPAGEATMALSRTDADTNPQPLSFVTPATSIRTRRPPARPLPSRKTMVLVGGGVAALVVSLVTTAIMLSRSPTPAPNSQTAATSKRPNSAASKPQGPPPPLAIAPFDAAMAKKHQQAWADYLGMPVEKEIKLPGNVPLIMVLIPPGEFMRSEDGKNHRVRITKPFYMGKYEVTQAQWQAVMGSNPSQFQDDPANPVEQVSWDDTEPFLTELNDARLVNQWRFGRPTEAQWEYACRAGTTTVFPFGNSEIILGEYAWYTASSQHKTHAAGQLKPNAFGLYDMIGNVWEWCDDWHGGYAPSPQDDPSGPTMGSDRVRRGGSWRHRAADCRAADRVRFGPSSHASDLGFRLALSFVGVPDKPGKENR